MNRENLIKALKEAISEVLEKMFFLPLECEAGASSSQSSGVALLNSLVTKITFNGSFSGYIVFYLPKELSYSLTADFLGTEPADITAEQAWGTAREITNMIAGNTFSHFNSKQVFDIGIPEEYSGDHSEFESDDQDRIIRISIDTENDHLEVRLVLDPDTRAETGHVKSESETM